MIQSIDPQQERAAGHERTEPESGAPSARSRVNGNGDVDPLESAIGHLVDIGENLRLLFALRAERRRLRIRKLIIAGIAVLLLVLALVPLVVAGVSRLVTGMAQGFTVMWGEREWLGNLTTGVVILGGTALIVLAFSSHLSRKGLSRKVASHGNVAR